MGKVQKALTKLIAFVIVITSSSLSAKEESKLDKMYCNVLADPYTNTLAYLCMARDYIYLLDSNKKVVTYMERRGASQRKPKMQNISYKSKLGVI